MNSNRLKILAQSKAVQLISKALREDANLHLVGGCIRDCFLEIQTNDIDLATKLTPEEVIKKLEKSNIRTIPTGLQHQTVTAVPILGQGQVEITTFRGRGMTPDGGVVSSKNIEEDLKYRDFTINALAFDIAGIELIDPNNALNDIEKKIVRAVGSPEERFNEDPLRILRMCRFACLPEFSVDTETKNAAIKLIDKLPTISVERIQLELNKILISKNPDIGFHLMNEINALETLFPEIHAFVDFEQNKYHKLNLFEHTLEVIKRIEPILELRLAALLHDIGKPKSLTVDDNGDRHFYRHEIIGIPIAKEFMKRFKYSKKQIELISTLIQTHMRPLDAGPAGLRRLLRDTGEHYNQWRKLKEADSLACKIDSDTIKEQLEDFDTRMQEIQKGPQVSPLKNLAINGNDLIELGIPKGEKIGEVLNALHEKVLDEPELNTKEKLLEISKESFL